MVKNVIFDIGKVLMFFDRDYLVDYYYKGDKRELLKEKVFDGWEQLDEGTISTEDYEKKVLDNLPDDLKKPASDILNNWEDVMYVNPGMESLIDFLKENGYRIFVLSNMTMQFIRNDYKFPILKKFDGIVYSSPIKMVKPNPDIFEYLFNKYNVDPIESVFVDDLPQNVEGGRKVKLNVFLYKNNPDELKEFILSL